MTELIQKETPVRLVQPIIEGVIKEAKVIDNILHYRVEYVGIDGETHERFFEESQIELIEQ